MSLKEKLHNYDRRIVVTIDGPAGVGKGLIGSMLAQEFAMYYVQSSIVYRGLAYLCYKKGHKNAILPTSRQLIDLSAQSDLLTQINGVDLSGEYLGELASRIATIKEVRVNLSHLLKEIIQKNKRIIMEGRDIGTVIASDADLKIYLVAEINIRAWRRFKQLQIEGKNCIFDEVLKSLQERDARDTERAISPLRAAEDALIIDTTCYQPEEVIQKVKEFVG